MSFKFSDNPFYNKKNDTYRVYLNTPKQLNEENIEKFKRETIIKKYIYTDQNILEVVNNKDIFKIHYCDVPVYSKSITDIPFKLLIDKSKETRGESVFHIPINHEMIEIEKEVYAINPKSNLKFNILKRNDDIIDFFFTTNEDLEHTFIKEELFTFVSLLN